jgi:hypothetical protein
MFYVFYNDGYADDGGVGFEEFASDEAAISFVEQRLAGAAEPDIKDYTIVVGRIMEIRAIEVVTKVVRA